MDWGMEHFGWGTGWMGLSHGYWGPRKNTERRVSTKGRAGPPHDW